MAVAQPSEQMKSLMTDRVNSIPGPQGDPENEAYMECMVDKCDALAMYSDDGTLMWAWSQDGMNAWYWHVDVDQDRLKSNCSYDYHQSDGSVMRIESEANVISKFIKGESTTLFFNGAKFHQSQKDVAEDGIIYAVMGSSGGRGVHCAISPFKDCMIVAAASTSASPSEEYFDLNFKRPKGSTTTGLKELGGMFRQFAPGALGI